MTVKNSINSLFATLTFLFSMALSICVAPLNAHAAAFTPNDSQSQQLKQLVDAGIPGAILLEKQGSSKQLLAAGRADITSNESLQARAKFRIGSITKTFVATVVLQLAQEGRVSLDAPIDQYLPGLLNDQGTITVRELLNHTSGLYDYTANQDWFIGTTQNRVFQPEDLISMTKDEPLAFTPGSQWQYSNTNYIVLGMLVQTVTKHNLGTELQHRIFDPLNLQNTSFPTSSGNIKGYYAHGYVLNENNQPLDVTSLNPSGAWAAGAIVSNAKDVAHFYRALFQGKLLNPAMLTQMQTAVNEAPGDTSFQYGLGIERVEDACGVIWGHGGQIFGYQSAAYWNPSINRMVVFATTQWRNAPAAQPLLDDILSGALCPANTTTKQHSNIMKESRHEKAIR